MIDSSVIAEPLRYFKENKIWMKDEDFKHFCGQLDSLAFLPVDDVIEGFDHLQQIAPDGCEELLSYFDAYYVNGIVRQRNVDNGNIRR